MPTSITSTLTTTHAPTFTLHMDPGHAWLAVPVHLLLLLGIAGRISRYSFLRDGTAYLEEDRDAATFLYAYHARLGVHPTIVEQYTDDDSVIRSYPPFSAA